MTDTATSKYTLQFLLGVIVITFVVGVLAVILVDRAGQRLDAPKLQAPVTAVATP